MTHALLLAGGELGLQPESQKWDLVIAADSGLKHADPLGVKVDTVIGDLDSVDAAQLEQARSSGAEVLSYPIAKDETDLELALRYAVKKGAHEIDVVGMSAGRADHELANFLLLAHPDFAETSIMAWARDAKISVIYSERELIGSIGSLASLIPLGGNARGVTTSGLLWKPDNDELIAGSTRGVSNEFIEPKATVQLQQGVLLAIQPG